MNQDFTEWLENELITRGWTRAELARRANVSQSTLSLIWTGERTPGPDFCRAIARALNIPPETVFRKAGLLPASPDPDPEIEEALYLFAQLPTPVRKLVLLQIRALAEAQNLQALPAKRNKTSTAHSNG